MITFLPNPNFVISAKSLDYRRLCKQRVEAKQIYNIISGNTNSNAWKNHPAVLMWKDCKNCLAVYHNIMVKEWIARGYNNNMEFIKYEMVEIPWWLGNNDFHRAQRARLINKKPEFYLLKWPDDINFNNNKYLWPVNETKSFRII